MLTCIACSKHEIEDGAEDTARAGTPSTKDAVKSLTSQIKDMVLKFSGSNRHCKGGSSSHRSKSFHHPRHHHSGGASSSFPLIDDDAASDGGGGGHYAFLQAASSSSTPAWDFTSIAGDRDDDRFKSHKWMPGVGVVAAAEEVVLEEDNGEPKEWVAQVEPGVHITFVSLPGCAGNDLKRIRFSREMFNKWQAQRWWGENYDRILELYNVQRFSRQALPTPLRSDDGGGEAFYSRVGSTRESPVTPPPGKERLSRSTYRSHSAATGKGTYYPTVPDPSEHTFPHHLNPFAAAAGAGAVRTSGIKCGEASAVEATRTTTSSRDEASISLSNAGDLEATEWVEQDEPGVFITIRELADGTRELRRVRFSREKFGEVHAKLWWEENRERIQVQYL
ncbi:protein Brevis radix-like 2 [Phoenix dactylifera]|uniref:Protein Brevis radix-like 2 n=1 Tax=Phoenix dactylifera TaxID=42345 RepID=A0A8B8ZKV0_PHODC|nr:protein Brevis radix-like 2 [Phoenix dactylifera]XP_038974812.1 protein Brevis radix-like 2 [Phoenix dactylifera]XP_038974813.1 protein Brevis radix-like 2 [Phoenix dactylifera]